MAGINPFNTSLLPTGVAMSSPSAPIANTYPDYEITTPQYVTPNPYQLATQGYRKNEIVYACIRKRAIAMAEAPMQIYQKPAATDKKGTNKLLQDHPLRKLLERPNGAMSEGEFWRGVEIYMLIAGYSYWEIERNNGGDPIALWPMRPDWCSTMRGINRPLAKIRYQPYGLPPVDVPVEDCLIFQDFDPIFPLLKGLSPTAVALRTVTADNAATDFLASFFQRGTVVSGILSTEQSLQDSEAERVRVRWRKMHGGTDNWADIAVLGSGTKYQPLGMTFKDMDFSNIDGRDEARLCSLFGVPTLLLGAKVGLTASTLSNFEQARKQFQEETVQPQRAYYGGEVTTQLVPQWDVSRKLYAAFDISEVRALQENQDALHTRVINDAEANLITRDEAREKIGEEAIDNDDVFIGVAVRAQQASDISVGGPGENDPATMVAELPIAKPAQLPQATQPKQLAQAATDAQAEPVDTTEALKLWRSMALDAFKSGGMHLVDSSGTLPDDIAEDVSLALISCKSASAIRDVFAAHWPVAHQPDVLRELVTEVRLAREALAQ